jgi:hypothetical protein
MSAFTYDPLRIVTLRQRTLEAIDELAGLDSSDPIAAPARRALQLTRMNLEGSWLDLIESIYRSPAMVDWRELDQTDGSAVLVSRLVDDFGARSIERRRVTPATAPGAVASTPLAERARTVMWRTALRHLDDALAGSGPARPALDRIVWMASSYRLPDGQVRDLDSLLGLLEALHWALAHGQLHCDDFDTVELALARLLAQTITSDADLEVLARAGVSDPGLGALIARHHSLFPPATTITMAAFILSAGVIPPATTATSTSLRHLLGVIADNAEASLQLLDDRVVMMRLVVDATIDAAAVEAVMASALGALDDAGGDRRTGSDRWVSAAREVMYRSETLDVLAELIAIAQDHELNPGARRGAARGLGAVIPLLGIHLDHRRPVTLAIGHDADDIVELGDYAALAGLVAQLLDDPPAQAVLGTMIGAYRIDQLDLVESVLERSAGHGTGIESGIDSSIDPGTATRMVGAALADVTRVLELVAVAQQRHADTQLLDFAMAKRQVQQVLTALGITAAILTGPAGPFVLRASHLISLSAAEIVTALTPDGSARVGSDLQASAAVHFTTATLSLVVASAAARRATGLEHLDDAVWGALEHHLEIIDEDPANRGALAAIEAIAAAHPELDTYLETVRAVSGEDSLG